MALDAALLVTGTRRAADKRTERAADKSTFAGVAGGGRANAGADGTTNNAIGDLSILRVLHVALNHIIRILLARHLIGIESRRRFVRSRHYRNHRARRCGRARRQQQD